MPPHIPVLINEILDALIPGEPPQRVIDGTLGAGGHSRALLERGVQEILGFDLDQQALSIACQTLEPYKDRVHLVHASYATMKDAVARLGWDQVDGILLDLGVSSMQLDIPQRGFAFMHDGPLDMRFDPSGNRPPASDLVNHWDEASLADLFFKYGEERHSRRLAKAVVAHRPYETTQQLAAVIADATPAAVRRKEKIHPATRVFQALRIAVNDELVTIEQALPMAIDLLRPGGRLAVMSFHSLEDRLVKKTFKEASTEIVSPPGMASIQARKAVIKLVNRKPIQASEDEMASNPRSRSVRLRVAEKL